MGLPFVSRASSLGAVAVLFALALSGRASAQDIPMGQGLRVDALGRIYRYDNTRMAPTGQSGTATTVMPATPARGMPATVGPRAVSPGPLAAANGKLPPSALQPVASVQTIQEQTRSAQVPYRPGVRSLASIRLEAAAAQKQQAAVLAQSAAKAQTIQEKMLGHGYESASVFGSGTSTVVMGSIPLVGGHFMRTLTPSNSLSLARRPSATFLKDAQSRLSTYRSLVERDATQARPDRNYMHSDLANALRKDGIIPDTPHLVEIRTPDRVDSTVLSRRVDWEQDTHSAPPPPAASPSTATPRR